MQFNRLPASAMRLMLRTRWCDVTLAGPPLRSGLPPASYNMQGRRGLGGKSCAGANRRALERSWGVGVYVGMRLGEPP